jgi:hypothetical protein
LRRLFHSPMRSRSCRMSTTEMAPTIKSLLSQLPAIT